MQTCRSCLSADIPDGATHCRHCGRRLRPSEFAQFVKVVLPWVGILAILIIIWATVLQPRMEHEKKLAQAHHIIDNVKIWCSPTLSDEEVDLFERRDQTALDDLALGEDASMINALYSNQVEVSGCGYNARRAAELAAQARARKAAQAPRAAAEKPQEEQEPSVTINPKPSDAVIYVDGEFWSGGWGALHLSPGGHSIRATYDNCKPFEQQFHLSVGEHKELKPVVRCPE